MERTIVTPSFATRPISRRGFSLGLIAAAASAAVGREATAARRVDFDHGRTYLTRLDNGVHVAIVVVAREALGFVADGAGRADWFIGSPGRSMTLVASDGARMTASFTLNGFKGRVVNADDSAFTFVAGDASGFGGLYSVRFHEGYVSGASDSGGQLIASHTATMDDGSLLMRGLVMTDITGSNLFEACVSADSWGRQWWIIQNDGRLAGGCSDGDGYGFAGTVPGQQ